MVASQFEKYWACKDFWIGFLDSQLEANTLTILDQAPSKESRQKDSKSYIHFKLRHYLLDKRVDNLSSFRKIKRTP